MTTETTDLLSSGAIATSIGSLGGTLGIVVSLSIFAAVVLIKKDA